MDKYRFDIDALLRTILLFGFTALLVWLIITQQVGLYVNPRFAFLVEFAAAILALMGTVSAPAILRQAPCQDNPHPSHAHSGGWTYLPFFMVLLLALLIPDTTLHANLVDAKGLNRNLATSGQPNVNSADNKQPASVPIDSNVSGSTPAAKPNANLQDSEEQIATTDNGNGETLPPSENIGSTIEKQPQSTDSPPPKIPGAASAPLAGNSPAPEFPKQASLLSVTQSNFVETIQDIYEHRSNYLGREISVIGFVYRNPDLSDTQFVVVRYLIICCAADASPYGLLCESSEAKKYPQGTWLSVRGTLKTGKFNDREVPSIKVTSVERIDTPQNPYVYLTSQ